CCCAAASSNVQPLTIDCDTAPETPAPSSSVGDARKTAIGVRNFAMSLHAILVPRPGMSFSASQWSSSSRPATEESMWEGCLLEGSNPRLLLQVGGSVRIRTLCLGRRCAVRAKAHSHDTLNPKENYAGRANFITRKRAPGDGQFAGHRQTRSEFTHQRHGAVAPAQ